MLWPFSRLSSYRKYRILEIIPGLLSWTTIGGALVISFIQPIWAIYFIIIFDLYWLVRILYMIVFVVISYIRYRRALRVDWLSRVQRHAHWDTYYHLVFIPTYQEDFVVLKSTFDALVANRYPLEKMIVVLAGEQRDEKHFHDVAQQIRHEYAGKFFRFLVTVHPAGISGEVAGKGSNMAWAGRRAQELIDSLQLPYDHVIVSSFDSDTVVHPDYFTHLTETYITQPEPTRASYQPLALFNNNIWDSPALTRIIAYSTTFWLMGEQSRPERMFTFSSHSMSLQALVDVGFWQADIVTEDSRICLQCYMEYDGHYQVIPLHIPVSMDVVLGRSFWQSLKNQYIQQRRWAYGVENFPYMIWNFGRNSRMPFIQKFRYMFNQLEGVYSWATAPILIFIMGQLPIWLANHRQYPDLLSQSAPHLLQLLMSAAMLGLLTQAVLGATLLPKRPSRHNRWKYIFMIVQWVFIPVTLIGWGAIPALDAQTRLMLGKYLGFDVTQKFRKTG
ncbi:MAG: glycosyltransferase family 2 protein [Patescibacteria group bacterium]